MKPEKRESKINLKSIGSIIIGIILLVSIIFMIYLMYSLLSRKDSDSIISDNIENQQEAENSTGEPKLEAFSWIEEHYIDYTFELSYDDSPDYFDRTYQASGSYDLNGDGRNDNFFAVIRPRDNSSYIEVNGREVTFRPDHPTGELYLIDLDSRDSYTELAVYDEGPSYDPYCEFFRYDGKELYRLGAIDTPAYMDGQGKIIPRLRMSFCFEPILYTAWEELRGNEFIRHNHDVEQYIGKDYVLDGFGYFVPMEESSEDYYEYVSWDETAQREFSNDRIRLLDIYTMSAFYIELQDGERGLLYFWTGD